MLRTIQSRGLDHSQVEPLIGVDGGQGFLKVGLILNECQTEEESKGERSKYSEVLLFLKKINNHLFSSRGCVLRCSNQAV